MTDDKKKKAPDKTQEGVMAALEICKLNTDASSRHITAGLIADNLAKGAKGVEAITQSARGISPSVGQCIADKYDEKEPSLTQRFTTYFNDTVTSVAAVASTAKADAAMIAEKMVMGGVSTVTNDTPETLKARPAQINKASAPGS